MNNESIASHHPLSLLSVLLPVCLAILVTTSPAEAFDENRLWLPVSYQSLYLKLRQAAVAADALDRCGEVLSGTLDSDRSKDNHPVFRITCRQPDGRSYNEMVDGISFETLTTPDENRYKLTEEERALKRLEEEKKMRAQREQIAWQVCKDQLQQRIRLMEEVHWLDERASEPVSRTEHELIYIFDFDARAQSGEALHYRSTCRFRSATEVNIKISKR